MSKILIVGSVKEDRDAVAKIAAAGCAPPVAGQPAIDPAETCRMVNALRDEAEAVRPVFEETCRKLGALLAERGHEIVVCSDAPGFADRLVVEGANAAGQADRPAKVRFFASEHELLTVGQADFGYPPQTFPHVTCGTRLTRKGWFSTYSAAIEFSDAVVSVGGSPRGTGGALNIALTRTTPVLAIPAFGGFSRELWKEFGDAYGTLPPEDQLALEGSDADAIAQAALRSTESLIAHNPFPKPRRGWWYAGLPIVMAALAAGWVALTTVSWATDSWVPYATAGATAMAGMLFRHVNDAALNRVAYAGIARVAKDMARVLGTLLGVFVLVYLFSLQTSTDTDSTKLFAAWLAVAGFTSGFLVEEVIGMLKNALGSAVGAGLKKPG